MLFCRKIRFVAIYALLHGDKFSQKLYLWRKKDKYMYANISFLKVGLCFVLLDLQWMGQYGSFCENSKRKSGHGRACRNQLWETWNAETQTQIWIQIQLSMYKYKYKRKCILRILSNLIWIHEIDGRERWYENRGTVAGAFKIPAFSFTFFHLGWKGTMYRRP